MPWWGGLLIGLVVGACAAGVVAAFLWRRRPAEAPGHAQALAEAEAEVDRLTTRVAELRLANVASAEREAVRIEAGTSAEALAGDPEAQADVVLDFLGGKL